MAESIAVSIIIPVLNEASCLDHSLSRLFADDWIRDHCEVIVCDGGSDDGSLDIAQNHPCYSLHCTAGRALQMNHGASMAQGQLLLFLHADSELPDDFQQQLAADTQWGFFRIRLDHPARIFRLIEAAINLRSRITRVAGGDQGLFFHSEFFRRLGGFATIPLMEDIAICKSARRLAAPSIVDATMNTSSRRWQQRGVIRTVLLMWILRFAYWLGVDPVRLHRFYYPQQG